MTLAPCDSVHRGFLGTMSNITYTPETKAQLEAWIDSCPRELANVIFVAISQVKDENGNVNHLGMSSIMNTRRSDAIAITKENILMLIKQHEKLDEGYI